MLLARSPCEADTEEKELISRILGGDTELYSELLHRHETAIFQLCMAVLRDPVEAEEAAHVAFIKAYESLAGFRLDAGFRTWITRIALNQCRDRLRTKRRRRMFSLDALLLGLKSLPRALIQEPPEDEPLPAFLPLEALETLSEAERAVLALARLDERPSYRQMALKLGISEDSVRGRMKRIKTKLRDFTRKQNAQG